MPSLRAQRSNPATFCPRHRGLLYRCAPCNDTTPHIPSRRAIARLACCLPLILLAGCGWAPLYADPQAAPAAAELRAIRVAPIPERIGQNLELALRSAFNPDNAPTRQHYLLTIRLAVAKQNLGLTTQGLGTLGRIDVHAHFLLADLATGKPLVTGDAHVNDSFDLLANGYSNVVAQSDAEDHAVAQLRDDLATRLTVFLQRRAVAPPSPPPAKT